MRIEPASVEQVRQASDGRMVLISADASTVAADLRRIDKGLKVRFAENGNPPFWAVYHETDDGRTQTLVLTQKASQNHAGVWEGLDQRIVRRIEEIDPEGRGGYDFVAELERSSREASERRRKRVSERMGEAGELAAHAARKDLHVRYRGRAFISKKASHT